LALPQSPAPGPPAAAARATTETRPGGAVTRRELRILALVVALGLALRLALVAAAHGVELYGDQAVYAAEAAQILAGVPTDAYRGPGYPAFLAAWQWLFGEGPGAPRVGNALAGGLAIVVFWALLRELFAPRAALIGAGLLAFYPRALFMPVYLFAENTYCLLLMSGIWMAIRAAGRGRRAAALAAGLAFGLGILTREMLVYFVPVAAGVLLLFGEHARRERALRAALLVATAAAVVLPWTIRNHRVHDAFVLVGYSDGIPLFEGNYPAPPPAVLEKRFALTRQYTEEARLAGIEDPVRQRKFANDRLREDAWRAIRERQPGWILEKLAWNGPRIFRPNVLREVLLGKWPMPPERQESLARVLLFGLFLPAHVLLLSLGAVGLAHWRLAGAAVLPLLHLGYSVAIHLIANAAHFRFEAPYEWVLLAGVALTLDRGLPRTRSRRLVALLLLVLAIAPQLTLRDAWLSGIAPYWLQSRP